MPGSFARSISQATTAALIMVVFVAAASTKAIAAIVTVSVPGTSSPWLAGMPDGTNFTVGLGSPDSAPTHSPVQVLGLSFAAGDTFTFTNGTGGVNNFCCAQYPLDGNVFQGKAYWYFPDVGNPPFGIASLTAPINSLVGVFLSDVQPDSTPAPAPLDFSAIGIDFVELSPQLKQPFFIGDGHNSSAIDQRFIVPVGATRLFLGTMDGGGWYNNVGTISIDVNVTSQQVSEPSTLVLFGTALAGFAAGLRRRSAQVKGGQTLPSLDA